MGSKLSLDTEIIEKQLKVHISGISTKAFGKKGTLSLVIKTDVHDSQPVNIEKNLVTKEFNITNGEEYVYLDLDEFKFYSYHGKKLDINIFLKVTINDSFFIDSKISKEIERKITSKLNLPYESDSIMEPADTFDFWYNFHSIPHDAKVYTLIFCFFGVIVITVNMILGIHDQVVQESSTWFYSHFDSDGEGSSPFMKALTGSGVVGTTIWWLIRSQLKKYMTFFFKNVSQFKKGEKKYKLSHMIGGKTRIELKDISLNIVACNIEKGKYKRTSGSGKKRRTRIIKFKNTVNAVTIYKEKIPLVPKNGDISEYIKGEFNFDKAYKKLYPPFLIGKQHGLDIRWEVQLKHTQLVDQELVGKNNIFKYEDFL